MIGIRSEKVLCQTDCETHGSRCNCSSCACCPSVKASSNSLGSFFLNHRPIEKIVGLVGQCYMKNRQRRPAFS